jgi:hypothetical protein
MDTLTHKIAEEMAALPCYVSKTSPEDGPASALRNAWEEFAREMQEEHSYAYEAFEMQVRFFARRHIQDLDWQDTALLWTFTSASTDRDDDSAHLHRSELTQDIEDELWQRACNLGETVDLSHYFGYIKPEAIDKEEDEPEEGQQLSLF